MARKHHQDRHARYLHIMAWAWSRYQDKNGRVVLSTGERPSTYSRIESAAFERYIRNPRDENGRLIFGQ